MEYVLPYLNSYLLGHEEAEQLFLQAWKNKSLHNSWLIGGNEGIGKATFAYKAARFLLAADENDCDKYHSLDIAPDNQVFRLVANRSHPDLKIIERDFIDTDKKKIIKAIKDGEAMSDEQLQSLKKSAVIKVDDVRTINEFLSKKSFDGNWRIVIVDSADDLNPSSANAILKILEEPPARSLIFLISHNPYRLLPTIRSRCAKLTLQPLPKEKVATLLRRYMPELSETEVGGLAQISGGSIGRALNYAQNKALSIYLQLEKLLNNSIDFDLSSAIELCNNAAGNEDVWNLVCELLSRFVSDMLKRGVKIKELSATWDNAAKMLRDAENLNMDKKQTLILIIVALRKALA